MIDIYSPILREITKKTFSRYVESLVIPQIDYFAVGIQRNFDKKSISLMSLPEWQKYFLENNYANYDPVRRSALYSKRNFIPFQEIDHMDNFGKEIMKKRAAMGIKNGIILMQRFPRFNYIVTLGTGFSKFNAFDFLNLYLDKISLIKIDLIKIIEKDAHIFLTTY